VTVRWGERAVRTRPGTPLLDRGGDLMDAIAEAIDDAQWRDHQPRD
jgi:hypothetical protein